VPQLLRGFQTNKTGRQKLVLWVNLKHVRKVCTRIFHFILLLKFNNKSDSVICSMYLWIRIDSFPNRIFYAGRCARGRALELVNLEGFELRLFRSRRAKFFCGSNIFSRRPLPKRADPFVAVAFNMPNTKRSGALRNYRMKLIPEMDPFSWNWVYVCSYYFLEICAHSHGAIPR
jgi:hypothetical protein